MPVILPCPMGMDCDYKTESVEEATALKIMDMHERLSHPTSANQATNGGSRKPEKFPRPSIDIDSTAEACQEFHGTVQGRVLSHRKGKYQTTLRMLIPRTGY